MGKWPGLVLRCCISCPTGFEPLGVAILPLRDRGDPVDSATFVACARTTGAARVGVQFFERLAESRKRSITAGASNRRRTAANASDT